MRSLAGKVTLVTGASRGLGVDIAGAFAREGARLALAARSKDDLEQTRAALAGTGAEVVAIPADVGDLESLRTLVGRTEEALGPIDVLVNNAGVEHVWDFEETDLDMVERVYRVNVLGLTWITRLVVPSMIERGGGHVCNVASQAGLTGVPHNSVYSASKHAVVGLSRSLRAELAEHGVEVSVVCPGFVTGGMFSLHGRKAPGMAGSVTPAQVARATVRAVRANRAEVVVAKGLGRIVDWFTAVSPDFTSAVMRRTGVSGFMEQLAKAHRSRADG